MCCIVHKHIKLTKKKKIRTMNHTSKMRFYICLYNEENMLDYFARFGISTCCASVIISRIFLFSERESLMVKLYFKKENIQEFKN